MKNCKICSKSVYPLDPQINLDGSLFHRKCAKCEDCSTQITTSNFRKYENSEGVTLVCEVHYNTRVVDRGTLWYTSNVRDRERVAGTTASQDALNRRGSLAVLSGTGLVQSVTPAYHSQTSPMNSQNVRTSPRPKSAAIPNTPISSAESIVAPLTLTNDEGSSVTRYEDSCDADVPIKATPAVENIASCEDICVTIQPTLELESNASCEDVCPVEASRDDCANPSSELQSAEVDTVRKAHIALQDADNLYGRLDRRSISLAEKLGTDLKRASYYEAAEGFYRLVLERRQELLGDMHEETVNGKESYI